MALIKMVPPSKKELEERGVGVEKKKATPAAKKPKKSDSKK